MPPAPTRLKSCERVLPPRTREAAGHMEEKSILVLGDSHARWDYLCSILAFYSHDLCIVAGDFGWWPKLFPLPHDILPASVLAATELQGHMAFPSALERELSGTMRKICWSLFFHTSGILRSKENGSGERK